MSHLPLLVTDIETARLLRTNVATVRRMVDDGTLPGVKLGANPSAPVRIRTAVLRKFVGLGDA